MPKTTTKTGAKARPEIVRVSDVLRVPQGPVDLAAIDARATPAFHGDKVAGKAALDELGPRLADLQERLFAEGRSGGTRRLLLVLQGLDTSGKGGTLRHVVGAVDPQGVAITSFKAPTREELGHDFLWRIKRALPEPGMVGVFDRSHYEDVVIARVADLVEPRTWRRRYATINRFEERLVADGTIVVKCFLHVSRDEGKARLLERLDRPEKHWKYNPSDVDTFGQWDDQQAAYADAIERCSVPGAPWHLVPADRKWYRNWAVMNLLVEHLEAAALQWPPADFDVEAERRRVRAL